MAALKDEGAAIRNASARIAMPPTCCGHIGEWHVVRKHSAIPCSEFSRMGIGVGAHPGSLPGW